MARTYSRDKNGRFASKGGGATRRGAVLTGRGGKGRRGGSLDARDTGKQSSVPKGAVGGSRGARIRSLADTKGTTLKKAKASYSARQGAVTRAKNKAASKPMANQVARGREAKKAYKAATSAARQAKMLAGGRTSTKGLGKRTDAGAKNIRANVKAYKSAQAKVSRMESKRKATRRRK